MKFLKTKKGNLLVKVSDSYGCYVSPEGDFVRSADDIKEEWDWAKDTWAEAVPETFPAEKETQLKVQLEYVDEYKKSLKKETEEIE